MKQLYASHYFDAWLDVAALIEQSAPAPRTYVVLVRRVRFDHLPNRGLFDIRGRIVRKVRDELRDELGRAKQMTEAAYHEQRGAGQRATAPGGILHLHHPREASR